MQTYPVMFQLRPHIPEQEYLPRVQQIRQEGGRLIAVMQNGRCLGCALFRKETRLFTGPMIYVDDLITDEQERSKGVGKALLNWIAEEAKRLLVNICILDSGTHRTQAHKFYFREGYTIGAFNFRKAV